MLKKKKQPDVTNAIIICYMCSSRCISKATEIQSEYVIDLSIPFPLEQWYAKAPHCYVCISPLLLHINSVGLRSNPGHRDEILVNNRLRYGVRPVFSLIKIFVIYFVKFMLH